MIYDVAIIGTGVTGAATAWQLSQYELKTLLIDKCEDVGFGVSKANSGIVHGGFHHANNSLKSKLEIQGNAMFDKLHEELKFPYHKCGILVVAFSEDEMVEVKKLYNQGVANGLKNLEICDKKRVLELEPNVNKDVVGAFLCPNAGTIEPYKYVFSLVEYATLNGVELKCNYKVTKANFTGEYWEIQNPQGVIVKARYVVNAGGLFADEISATFGAEAFTISPRKGEEYLLDRATKARPNHVLFPVPSPNSKGILVIPTAGGTTMVGPTAEMVDDKEDLNTTMDNMKKIVSQVSSMVENISPRDLISSFAGLRPVIAGNDFYIEESKLVKNFIQAAGIQSPGLTASPAIGVYIKELLVKIGLELGAPKAKSVTIEKSYEVRNESLDTVETLAQKDAAWSNIVCRCEKISEAEIVEAIHKGHHTVDGIKFYTRATMGRCQGGFCTPKILKIISRETNIPMEKLIKNSEYSYLNVGKLGDFKVNEVEND